MSNYIRPRISGSTVFFTVNLVAMGTDLLTRHIDILRDAARRTRQDKPFHVDAWVVLPDYMHCMWTLPDGDMDYSNRMGMLKSRFTRELGRSGERPTGARNPFGAVGGRKRVGLSPDLHGELVRTRWDEQPVWQKRFWEHHIRNETDFREHLRYCWHNPVEHGLCAHPRDWPYSSYHRDGVAELVS